MPAHEFSLFSLFSLAGGLALFLYGMQQGEKNIRRLGGAQLRKMIAAMTRHRIFAYTAGLVTTLITQSSSATTVILVGLVNARFMTLGQSLGMILGADLGTTVTVQLFAFKFHQIAPLLIAGGFFASMRGPETKSGMYGKLTFALGLIFFGMHMMAESVTPMRSLPIFERMLQASFSNPWYGLLAGTIITAVIQSSAATLTIVIALLQSMQGEPLPLHALFPLVMGANLGTCATAFISTFGADIAAKRVAWSHFFFKFFGIAIVLPLLPLSGYLAPILPQSPALQIALLHTFFNIIIGIVFLPLLHPFEKAIHRFVKPLVKTTGKYHLDYLSEGAIELPALATTQASKEIYRMGELVLNMANKSRELIDSFSLTNKQLIAAKDDEVDFLHEHIIAYLTKLARVELDTTSADLSYQLLMITTDLEHIGDSISKNVIVLAQKIIESPLPLSTAGKTEIIEYYSHAITDLTEILAAFTMRDSSLASAVLIRKTERDELYNQLFGHHVTRLFNRKPESLQTTSIHIDLLEEIRKIDHYVFRIAGYLAKRGG